MRGNEVWGKGPSVIEENLPKRMWRREGEKTEKKKH